MIEGRDLKGWLLAAHPRYPLASLRQTVMLVTDQSIAGCIGIIVNRPMTNGMDFSNVMYNAGIEASVDEPLYSGGPETPHRVFMLHTMDWFSSTTQSLAPNIGLSKDISVLSAIAENRGPEQFRAFSGYISWSPGQLEGEISGRTPWSPSHSWIGMPATPELLFDVEPHEQWARIIELASQIQVQNWFNLFLD